MTTTPGPSSTPSAPRITSSPRPSGPPPVPTAPPAVTVRPASATALRHVGLGVVAFFALGILGLPAAARGLDRAAGTAVGMAAMVLGAVVLALLVRRYGRSLVAEIELGYTTSRPRTASWWLHNGPKRGRSVVWDLSGLWFLRPSGEVRAAPQPTPHPPGWYASPRDPARLELWTGCQWSGLLGARTDGLLPL
ncbi:hypothetical protein KMZ32_18660 [Phycicoccus sp. MAQZ13P-2]|uniref:hypothetical protein n=1 Tax=Phycicoccus mangrovi TaxID=2840470 RepID=UPI001C00476F|nr:hypothetical protein [Phycicoccus mangrovi]MBT9257660.1 hypothetical protein [Phycicoccus mangrovi]MBT9276100.1 hypothetical protein [Phycicoccus mangrovi]